jgi:uncharacterized protein (TIGR00255 family)
MTAFSSQQIEIGQYAIRCDIKTLNSRFLECNVKLPSQLKPLEVEIIQIVKDTLARGKVDIYLDLQKSQRSRAAVNLDPARFKAIAAEIAKVTIAAQEALPTMAAPTFAEALQLYLSQESGADPEDIFDQLRGPVIASLKDNLAKIKEMRSSEGGRLADALKELLVSLAENRQQVAQAAPEIIATARENLAQRLADLAKTEGEMGWSDAGSPAFRERLNIEIALLTDKLDIKEELTRLASHEQEFAGSLEVQEPTGRKLDFLCQEMHREINTISSKLNHLAVSRNVLTIKQLVEQIRQQVQNIE